MKIGKHQGSSLCINKNGLKLKKIFQILFFQSGYQLRPAEEFHTITAEGKREKSH